VPATEISVQSHPGPDQAPVEVVERKGLGHPDTLADALAERMSVAYARHCLERFGAVLHHNLDKLYLRGRHARTDLGAFEMTAPITLTIGGRVSTSYADKPIDHRGLFEQVTGDYLSIVVPNFDHRRWLRTEHATTDRSRFPIWFHPRDHDDLPELTHPTASDTVAVTAWWPHTPTERVTLALERHLNQEGAGPRDHRLGQDIKVMAIRRGRHVDITVNVAVHPSSAPDTDSYDAVLAALRDDLDKVAARELDGALDHRLHLNTGDSNPYRASVTTCSAAARAWNSAKKVSSDAATPSTDSSLSTGRKASRPPSARTPPTTPARSTRCTPTRSPAPSTPTPVPPPRSRSSPGTAIRFGNRRWFTLRWTGTANPPRLRRLAVPFSRPPTTWPSRSMATSYRGDREHRR